eukprot:bmy_07861T0
MAKGLVLLDCPAQSLLELTVLEFSRAHPAPPWGITHPRHRGEIEMQSEEKVHWPLQQVTRVESLSPELRGQLRDPRTSSRPQAPAPAEHQNPLRQKLPPGAEAGAVLAGELGFLEQPVGVFVFFGLLLGPPTQGRGYHEMGRAVAILLSDPQFQWSVRWATNFHDLLAALDAFLEEVTVLPLGRWDPTAQIPPPKCLPSEHKRSFPKGLGSSSTVEEGQWGRGGDRKGADLSSAGPLCRCETLNLPLPEPGFHSWCRELRRRVAVWPGILSQLGFPLSSGSPRNCGSPRAPLPGEGPRLRTGTAAGRTRPARSCGGLAGEASWGGSEGSCPGRGEESHGPRGVRSLWGAGEAHLAPGTWDAGTWITDDPRAGGSLSRTCAGRPRGTPATSWTPCTPSASRPCSAFTWPPSLTPSLSEVCWEKPPTGVLESFLGTAVAGAAFFLMAGQPLTILSSTGPVLVFEHLLFSFSRDHSLDYLPFRLWVGIWVATFCLVLVATEASVLVRYFTRFTEEGFCALISLIFIYDAVGKMLTLTRAYPIQRPGSPAYGCQYSDPGGPAICYGCRSPVLCTQSQWTSVDIYFTAHNPILDQLSTQDLGLVNASLLPPPECARQGGHPRGPGCHTVPDIAFFSILLFVTSFLFAMALKHVKTSRFFPSMVCKMLRDFFSVLAILLGCGLDAFLGLAMLKLTVPREFKLCTYRLLPPSIQCLRACGGVGGMRGGRCGRVPRLECAGEPTLPGRGWLVSLFGANPWWLSVAATLPALLLSILIFMDQQITGVIPNCTEYRLRVRPAGSLAQGTGAPGWGPGSPSPTPEDRGLRSGLASSSLPHRYLQKGAGFHLDLLCVAVLMLLTSALGLPWCVSATVISLAHMDSLRRESRACAPGEAPSFLGIREQRPTGLAVFILTGISIFLASFIPMPLLYGIFLYMGVTAISSIQFTKRVQLLLMPAKHQPDLLLLRHVPLRRVHFFTAIQLACLGLLWIIKSTPAAIIFPLMVTRGRELLWLDEPMPETERSITEKGLEPEYSFSGSDNEDVSSRMGPLRRTGQGSGREVFSRSCP